MHSKFFEHLAEDKRIEIKGVIEQDKNFKALALFLQTDIIKHVNSNLSVCHQTACYLVNYIKQYVGLNDMLDYCIALYVASGSYDTADWRFDDFIEPNINEFSLEQLIKIMKDTESNGKIYCRKKAAYANRKIRSQVLIKDEHFDFTQYHHFQ